MATNNQNFQAEVVAGIQTPGSAEAAKVFTQLNTLVEGLEGQAKEAGKALVTAFEAGKKPAELATQIRILQRELRFLGTVSGGADLFKDTNVSKINEIQRAINAAAKAYDAIRESEKLSRYELGLESKTLLEAASAMSTLERNIKAVDLALSNNAGNAALQQKQKLLQDNRALLELVVKDLKQQAELERQLAAQQKGNTLNASGERQMQYTRRNIQQDRDSQDFFNSSRMRELNLNGERQEQLRQRRAQEMGDRLNVEGERELQLRRRRIEQLRREVDGSAREQTRIENTRLDYSQTGRDYAAQQTRVRFAGIQSSLLPGQEDIALQRVRDTANRGYLNQSYRDAGLVQTSLNATLRDGPQVRALVAQIRDIENQIVQARQHGNVDLQNELRLLGEIRTRSQQIESARYDQNLNDPQRRQARQDSQARNMLNRATGEGGAALLAVQASLMANYSILSSGVSAVKNAITGSIELEAAFRNVQAVTGTTRTEMAGLEHTIESVAAASKFSSKEVADAALILGQAGLSAKQVGEALQPVILLASAAGTSVANAVDLVTSIIGVFDKNTSDIADIANKITQAANASKVSVEKLGLGFQYAGNAAAASGITFEETTAAMAAMSNAGIRNGSTMGTGLRQFITETQKPTQEFLASLQRVGLSISDIDFKSHGLIGVTQRLREAGFTATDAIKSFDVRGAAAFNALIANPEELERQYRLLLDTKAGVEANEVQMDSLKSQSARLTTSLENLAAAGFDPLGRLLTATVGGFATLTQAVSEHNVVVGVAGTALAGLAASGAASYLTSMAAGALRWSSAAGTASAAVTLLQNASKAGSVGMLVTSISSGAAALAAWTPAAAGAAGVSWTLAGAINGVKTAIMGLSITTGIGLAVVTLTAGYYAFDAIANKTERDLDKLKATTNSAKGAFEEKDAAVKSLTEKIEELTYKQSSLRSDQGALTLESAALVSQFGQIGYQADANNVSFDTMIDKLRKLKTEMAEIRKQSLETALAENRSLLQKQTEKAADDVSSFRKAGIFGGNQRAGADLNTLMTGDYFKGLSAANQQKIRTAQQQLQEGNVEKMGDVPGATLILQKLLADMRSKGRGDSSSYDRLEGVVNKMVDVGKSISAVNNTRSDIARQELTLNRDAAYKGYNESGRFGTRNGKPVTFEDSLPQVGSLEVSALQKLGKKSTDLTPLEIFEAAKKEQQSRAQVFKEKLAQIQKDAGSGVVSPETFATFRQMINERAEKDKGEVLQLAKASEDDAKISYTAAKRDLQKKLKNAKDAKDFGLQKDLTTQLNQLELTNQNRVEFNDKKIRLNEMNSQYQLDDELDGLDAGQDRSFAGKSYQNQKRLLASQMKNAKMKRDKDAQIRIRKQMADMEITYKNRNEADPDRASANVDELLEIRDQDIQNINDKTYGSRGTGKGLMQRLTERSLRLQAEAKDAEAEEIKNSTKTATSMEELDSLLDKAVAAKVEAKTKRIAALTAKQKDEAGKPGYNKAEGDLAHKLEMDALISGEDSKINSFATSFVSLLETAAARLDKVTKAINDQKREIAEDKWQGEDRVFEAQQELRELDLQMAIGKKTRGDSKSTVTYGKQYVGGDHTIISPDAVTVNSAMSEAGSARTKSSSSPTGTGTTAAEVSQAVRETLTQRRNRLVVESTKKELEENEKLLQKYGDDTTGLIGNMSKAYKEASDRVKLLAEQVKNETDSAKKSALTAELESATKQQGETFRDLRQAKGEQKQLRQGNQDIRKRQAENLEAIPQEVTLDNLLDKLDDVWAKYQATVGQMNVLKVVGDGMSSIIGNTTGQLGNAFAAIVTGTKSVKDAFRDMAASTIKAMIDILAQAAAMQAVKGILGWAGIGMSIAAPAAAPAAGGGGMAPTIKAATGGYIVPGGIQRKAPPKMAGGGPVTGGIEGRDSVPTTLMPGEFVLKKQAVDAVGTDYLHSLNASSNSIVSQSSPVSSTSKKPDNNVVNVWVVTPDQKPAGMGPKDIVVAVTDDIARGGSVKQMIKTVLMGQ